MSAPALLVGALAATSAALAVAACAHRSDRTLLEALGGGADPGIASRIRRSLVVVGTTPLGRAIGRRASVPVGSWAPEELAGAKVLGPLAAGAMLLLAPAPLPMVAPVVALLAHRVPDLLLARSARRRKGAAGGELPLFLDLLAVAVSAGLPPQLAVREAVAAVRGPLGDELRAALRAADLGGRWRDELRAAAERLSLPELVRTASVLSRSESLGSSLAGEAKRLALDVRESRRAAATERARTAPVKMLFPLVFLVLPAFLLLTVVPVLLTTVRSID